MDEEQIEQNRRNAKRRRIRNGLLGFGAFVAAACVLLSFWWSSLNSTPTLKIPMPVMPNPNARDYFIKAASVSIEKNIAGTIVGSTFRGLPGSRVPTLAEANALVRQNAAAFSILHQGFAYPYMELPDRSIPFTVFSHYAKYRSLARLLSLKAYTEAARGDWYGALNSDMDAIQLGQMMPHGAPLIGSLVSIAIQAIGGKNADATILHLTARQARDAARRMERIIALYMPWADVMQEEKWTGQAHMIEMFRDPKWRQGLENPFGNDDNSDSSDEESADKRSRMEKVKETLRLYMVNKHEVLYNYTHYMDQVIANARLPYAAHPPDPPVPDDPVNQIYILSGNIGRNKAVQAESQNALLCLRLAVQAYHLDHSAYPPTLQALVPDYLSKLPDDPYAMQGSYGYTLDKVGYTLTSGAGPATPATKPGKRSL